MDKNKHKLYMAQILSLIFKDKELCNALAFKGLCVAIHKPFYEQ